MVALLQLPLVAPHLQHQITDLAVQLVYLAVFVQDQILQLGNAGVEPALGRRKGRGWLLLELKCFVLLKGRETFLFVLAHLELVGEIDGLKLVIFFFEAMVLLYHAVKLLRLVFESVLIVLHHLGDFLFDAGREGLSDLEGEAVLPALGGSGERVEGELFVILLVLF